MDGARDRGGLKWDRAARYLKVAMILHAHPEGVSAQQIADQIGVSKRTVYRDLEAMDSRGRAAHLAGQGSLGPGGRRVPAASQPHAARGDGALPGRPGAGQGERRARHELIAAFVKLARHPAAGARRARPGDRRRLRRDTRRGRAVHARAAHADRGLGRPPRGRDRLRRRRLRPDQGRSPNARPPVCSSSPPP